MSFSSEIKEELSKLNNWTNKEALKAELNGYYLSSNNEIQNEIISFSTESIYTIERLAKILQNLKIKYEYEEKGKMHIIRYANNEDIGDINVEDKEIIKSVLRGAFVASGVVNNPNQKYHLELFLKTCENAQYIKYIAEQFGILVKILERKTNFSVYLKDGETISNFLALIGASKAVLNFEEIRVVREMKNNVNRIVNCETANLNKIVNVAVSQIEDIKFLIEQNKFNELPDSLKEVAKIRIENPDSSLMQMGQLLEKPLGKSGVNHRLKKISEIANELRKEKA